MEKKVQHNRNHEEFVKEFYGDYIQKMQEISLKEYNQNKTFEVKSEFSIIPPWFDKKEFEQKKQNELYQKEAQERAVNAKIAQDKLNELKQMKAEKNSKMLSPLTNNKSTLQVTNNLLYDNSKRSPSKRKTMTNNNQKQEDKKEDTKLAEQEQENQKRKQQQQLYMDGCKNQDALIISTQKISKYEGKDELSCDIQLMSSNGPVNDKDGKPCSYQCEYLGQVNIANKECTFSDQIYFLINMEEFIKNNSKQAKDLQLIFIFSQEVQQQNDNNAGDEEVQVGFVVHQVTEKGKLKTGTFTAKILQGEIGKFPIQIKKYKELPLTFSYDIQCQKKAP